MTGELLPVRIGPCLVCGRRRGVEVSAPGFPGGIHIGCPCCTRRGAEQLLELISVRVAPADPGGAA